MGFGSYDESEQERQEIDTNDVDADFETVDNSGHSGDVEFEMEDTDSALERLKKIQKQNEVDDEDSEEE